jgi:predicted acylesterase/phospholipase RssA
MALALDELGVLPAFDAVYGSSAGALNGAWLLCGRSATGVRTWWNPVVMRRIINPLHTLRGRAVAEGYVPIGFGPCTGTVHPAKAPS